MVPCDGTEKQQQELQKN